jgi:hypothetical protein
MREVLAARSDRDFVGAGPRRRSDKPELSRGRRLLAAALERPGALLGSLVIAGATTAIVVNALSFQSSRHPAPIFAKSDRVLNQGQAPEAAPPAVAPTPPVRPPVTPAPAAVPQPPARAAARDAIGDMIRADTTGSASSPGRLADARGEPQRPVAAAQRALGKLGYGPLKADGVFGPGTRQAIERFERDRHLTPTGELGPRTARELSVQSGIRVE